jgi:hypothetical protein
MTASPIFPASEAPLTGSVVLHWPIGPDIPRVPLVAPPDDPVTPLVPHLLFCAPKLDRLEVHRPSLLRRSARRWCFRLRYMVAYRIGRLHPHLQTATGCSPSLPVDVFCSDSDFGFIDFIRASHAEPVSSRVPRPSPEPRLRSRPQSAPHYSDPAPDRQRATSRPRRDSHGSAPRSALASSWPGPDIFGEDSCRHIYSVSSHLTSSVNYGHT